MLFKRHVFLGSPLAAASLASSTPDDRVDRQGLPGSGAFAGTDPLADDRSRVHLHPLLAHPTMSIERRKQRMSEHHEAPKSHEPHALHEEHAVKGPHDPKEINPKLASDIAYWSKEFGVTGDQLHKSIRSHGTHVDKVRAALHAHKTA
jgi:hypothetical protein